MPKRTTPLTDMQIRAIKPAAKDIKTFDGHGLFLLVTPTGGRLWRLKYRFGGREKLLTLGAYPQISLSDVRQKREEARMLLAKGIDPGAARKEQAATILREQETFEMVAREWHNQFKNLSVNKASFSEGNYCRCHM